MLACAARARAAQQRRDEKNSQNYDNDSLPSYTIVTGLPTYDEAIERMKPQPPAPPVDGDKPCPPAVDETKLAISVVDVKDEPPVPDPKFGLVSHSLFAHDDGCSHCLSVQELLETYNVR